MVYYIHQRGEFCICDFVYAQTHHHREDNEGVCVCVCVWVLLFRCDAFKNIPIYCWLFVCALGAH